MSWIDQIDESQASGELAAVYAELVAQRGKVANILKVHSLRPQALRDHLALYMGLMFGAGELTRRERELVAVAVSQANRCAYCAVHHLEALARYERDPARLAAIRDDCSGAPFGPRDRALVDYADKLTRTPQAMREDDLAALRAAGLDDHAILQLNLIVAYFNFVNRIALGLGVAYSDDEVSGYRA
jgi:uncharacterized peroxidase-related enzyme